MIHYDKPVSNVLAQLEQFWVLPQHVWQPQVGVGAKNLKNYDPGAHTPIVGGGSFYIVKYDKKGTTIMQANPGYYGPKPKLKAVGVTFFQNSDSMIAALKGGEIDGVDEVPQTVVASLKQDPKFKVTVGPGEEIRNLGFNSNPKKPKNRELLEPKVRGAFAHAINRQQIVNVVFRNYAKPAYSLLTSISAPYLNTKLAPEAYNPALANSMLDKLGYKRGSGGVRVANGHKMSYTIITPSETAGMNREFAIVKQDLAKIGIAVTQSSLDATTAFSEITAPKNKYLSYDMMMWDWIGYIDPDYILTVVNCNQYGNRSDTALLQQGLRQALRAAGRHHRPRQAQADHLEDAGHAVPRQAVHPACAARPHLRLRQGLERHQPALPERPQQDPVGAAAEVVGGTTGG